MTAGGAARTVNESRARLLVQSGRIRAQKVGGRWVIDEADAAHHRAGVPAGRPLSERSAWHLLKRLSCSHLIL